MEDAVYARQSVEKQNSLSIDGQIDLWKAFGESQRRESLCNAQASVEKEKE